MIVILNHSIGPYHAARYSRLPQYSEEIMILEFSGSSTTYPWKNMAGQSGVRVDTLFQDVPVEFLHSQKAGHLLRKKLAEIEPEVLLTVSYGDHLNRVAAKFARENHVISINFTDSTRMDKRRYFPLELAKGMWCRKFYDAMFVGGLRSKDYYSGLGFPSDRIWMGTQVVDNDFFHSQTVKVHENPGVFRARLNLPEKYFICPARYVPVKNLDRLIRAFGGYRRQGGLWDLVFLGSGYLETALRELAAQEGVSDHVVFTGWKQYNEMPAYYSLAGCMILPSLSEPWGLVTNEAMACELPVLLSRRCGCLPELCRRGINGYDFDPYDIPEITGIMKLISSGNVDLKKMGEISWKMIQAYPPENYADAFFDCVRWCRQHCKPA